MRTFRALVVDDDDDVLQKAVESVSDRDDVEVLTASNLEDADALVTDHFFNAAFIDLQLDKKAVKNVDGQTILNQLRTLRPACRRLLLTVHFNDYRDEMFRLLDPQDRLIDGAFDKESFGSLFADVLSEDAQDWLHAPFVIENLQELFTVLAERSMPSSGTLRGRSVQATPTELDYVVSRLFGQGVAPDDGARRGNDGLQKIHLQPLTGGKSRSIVTVGRPFDGSNGQGIHCVVKIGSRADTVEEVRRYERFVRYRVSLHRRVELLGSSLGDALGAVCYSFAGRSPDAITDLQSLMDEKDPNVLTYLEQLLGDAEEWYAENQFGDDLAKHFFDAYDLDGRAAIETARSFSEQRAHEFGARKVGNELIFENDNKVWLPTDQTLGAGYLRGKFNERIVHGDLNASNVIVSDDGDLTLIDFRHTARGPYAIDFAALHASIRLSPPSWQGCAREAVKIETNEFRLWRQDWTQADRRPADAPPLPYWIQVASTLMRLAFSSLNGLTKREYASTCLLYALRIFRIEKLDAEVRFRLLLWISALCRVLDAESERS